MVDMAVFSSGRKGLSPEKLEFGIDIWCVGLWSNPSSDIYTYIYLLIAANGLFG
jgi:hypothetical protein